MSRAHRACPRATAELVRGNSPIALRTWWCRQPGSTTFHHVFLMSHKRKGQLVVEAERVKHLRSYLKRRFAKRERKAAKEICVVEPMHIP